MSSVDDAANAADRKNRTAARIGLVGDRQGDVGFFEIYRRKTGSTEKKSESQSQTK